MASTTLLICIEANFLTPAIILVGAPFHGQPYFVSQILSKYQIVESSSFDKGNVCKYVWAKYL